MISSIQTCSCAPVPFLSAVGGVYKAAVAYRRGEKLEYDYETTDRLLCDNELFLTTKFVAVGQEFGVVIRQKCRSVQLTFESRLYIFLETPSVAR